MPCQTAHDKFQNDCSHCNPYYPNGKSRAMSNVSSSLAARWNANKWMATGCIAGTATTCRYLPTTGAHGNNELKNRINFWHASQNYKRNWRVNKQMQKWFICKQALVVLSGCKIQADPSRPWNSRLALYITIIYTLEMNDEWIGVWRFWLGSGNFEKIKITSGFWWDAAAFFNDPLLIFDVSIRKWIKTFCAETDLHKTDDFTVRNVIRLFLQDHEPKGGKYYE